MAGIAILRFLAGTIAPVTKAFERGESDEALRIFARGVLEKEPFERLPEVRKQQMRDNLSTLRAGMLHHAFPPSTTTRSALSGCPSCC